jgi:hypothetical protein
VERERVLAFLRELEDADEEVGAVLAELDVLLHDTEAVRQRALELEAFFLRLPAEREAASAGVAHAREEVVTARAALAEAERTLARAAEDEDPARQAGHFAVRAKDRVTAAERRVAEAEAATEALERRASAAREESGALEKRARGLAEALRSRPRLAEDAGADPPPGLGGVAEWGSAARAALFVARGQLAIEREAVIRQANELGSLALGEPLASASAAVVARRVRHELVPDDS